MRSPCIKVPKSKAEETKKILAKKGLLQELRWKREGDYVIIPVKGMVEGFEPCEDDFEKRKKRRKIGSFDIVGDVAIVKHRDGNLQEIIEEIKNMKNIRKIAIDYGVKGEERIRDLRLVEGDDLITIHREYGIRLKTDLSKVYFSPRLAMERWRVVQMVKNGEIIFDMFAGCGPFSVMIAKYRDVKIYATDINPYAIAYLKENIKINRVKGIETILGDAREVAKKIKADRIIMNLPHSSFNFLPDAFKASKSGTIVHYYEILPKENSRENEIMELAEEEGVKLKIKEKRRVHAYSPSKDMFAFIIKII